LAKAAIAASRDSARSREPVVRFLASEGFLMLGRIGLHDSAPTLEVDRCTWDVAQTLPVSRVINDPHLLAIHPRDREGRDGYYCGQGKKKPAHCENPPFPTLTRPNLLGGCNATWASAKSSSIARYRDAELTSLCLYVLSPQPAPARLMAFPGRSRIGPATSGRNGLANSARAYCRRQDLANAAIAASRVSA
jgi:hypothetical protein